MSAFDKLDDVDITTLPYNFQTDYNAWPPAAQTNWRRDRFRAKHDHIFLGTDVLGMDFQENPHRLLFEQFIPKQPGTDLAYSDLDQNTKKRMILWSRGTFKTSSIIVEIVQTILNYPNIRMCFLTGGDQLAKRQLARTKRVFERPTKRFDALFPEFCGKKCTLDEKANKWIEKDIKLGNAHEFTIPCRTNTTFAEPTFAISTARSVKAGSHFDVIFIDDLVNELMNVDEFIPTPRGFIRNGDLKTGDYTFGQDGKRYRVVAHSAQEREAYRVSFDDGTSVLVHAGHLWTTWSFRERLALHRDSPSRRLRAQVRRTDEILATLRYNKKGHTKGSAANHAVRVADAIELPEKDLLLHPYALGVWLGDGSSKQSIIAGIDLEIFGRLKSFGVYSKKLKTKDASCPIHGLYLDEPRRTKRGKNRFTAALKVLGVFDNKHIPFDYLWSSKTQRLELLRGLMDADGCCSRRGLCIFVNTNENLADGVYHLASSLGLKPHKSVSLSKPGKKIRGWYSGGVPTYRITWTSPLPVFGLSRKLARLPKNTLQAAWRYIVNVEKTNQKIAMRCLTSENPEGLYLFGRNFNVTHNTNYRSVKLLEKCYQDYIDICPLLEPTGYIIMTGTRYSYGDTYERIQEMAKVEEKEFGKSIWKFSIRDCWSLECRNCSHRDGYNTDIYHDKTINIIEPPCTKCACRGFEPSGIKGVLFPATRTKDGRSIGHTLEFLEGERIRLGSEFFACFPAGSKVLRADWSETAIEDLRVGDGIVGFDTGLTHAVVQHVHAEQSEVVRAITESGRTIVCTPDHKFLLVPNGPRKYAPLKIGRQVVSVYRPQPIPTPSEQRDLDWLGGIMDGEGSGGKGKTTIAQSQNKNPETFKRIDETLRRLGIDFGMGLDNENRLHRRTDIFELRGGRSLKVRLLRDCRMAKNERFVRDLWCSSRQIAESSGRRGGWSSYDRVVSLESLGKQTVYNIQSSSGNFVCQGYAVKNCQYENSPLAVGSQTFTEALLGAQTLHHPNQIPTFDQSYSFVVGDLAYVGQEDRDFSVLFMCRLFKGQIFVHDCLFGNWDSGAVAKNLVSALLKHRPAILYLEKFNGWEAYNTIIAAYAASLGVQKMPIVWLKGSQAPKAKLTRIGAVKGVLQGKRLWLYSAMDGYEQLVKQLLKWPKLGRHDDFADTLGMVIAAPSGYQNENPPTVVSNLNWLRRLQTPSVQDDGYPDMGMGNGIVG